MTVIRWIATGAAFAALAFPALSFADHHNESEDSAAHQSDKAKAGGKAAEHRSETAAERSNAQWDEDNEGRPDKRVRGDDQDGEMDKARSDDDRDADEQDKQGQREKKGKKDKKSKQNKSPKSNN